MKKLTLSLLCAGLITTVAIAEDMCNATFQAGNDTQAEQCYIKQLKKERSFDNLLRIGISLVRQQHYKESLPYLTEAEKKAKSLKNFATIYSYLGITYYHLDNLEKAYAYWMKQLDVNLKIEDRSGIAAAYNNLGQYYKVKSEFKKALEYYEKALNYEEDSEKGTVYNNIAGLNDDIGDMKKAEEMYLKAIANGEKYGNYGDLGMYKTNLAILYYRQARYDEAKIVLEEALVIARNAGLKETETTALEGLSLLKSLGY